jgi:NAD(P)H-flavin reductase
LTVPLVANTVVGKDVHKLVFDGGGEMPRAGQFFMVKPARTGVFLGRPVSVFEGGSGKLTFVVAEKGAGTGAICAMRPGEAAELIGPLGNIFADFLPGNMAGRPVAVVSGGIGVAPIAMFARELRRDSIGHTVFAGFKSGDAIIDPLRGFTTEKGAVRGESGGCFAGNVPVIITEDGSLGEKGLVTDFLVPAHYAAVFACGPLPMLRAVHRLCAASGVPCSVSMETRMACGVGACLGCRISTKKGNRRCCKDGPVFDAGDIEW